MQVTITIKAETSDPFVTLDATKALERILPYMFDNVIVLVAEYESPVPPGAGDADEEDVTKP